MTYLQFFVFDFVSCGCPLPNQDVENDSPEPSDWDRFAAEEYETLVAEESAQAQFQEGWVSLPWSCRTFFNRGNNHIRTTLKNQASNPFLFLPFLNIIKMSDFNQLQLNEYFPSSLLFPSSLISWKVFSCAISFNGVVPFTENWDHCAVILLC